MEAILFYGDQDEATRRQVRSVAAQYSHRIGPRKRKKSKLPKPTGLESRHGHYQKLVTGVSEAVASSSSPHQSRPLQIVGHGHYTHHVGPHVEPGVRATLEAQQQSQRDHLLHREYSGSDTCPSSSEVGSEPKYSPHTPQLGFPQRTAVSQSPESQCRRLPAYTWTEYPRYAVTGSGAASPPSTSINAVAARRLAFELPDPTTFATGLGLQQNAPRSHPMDMPPKMPPPKPQPQQSPMVSDLSDHMLSRNSEKISRDVHLVPKEGNAHSHFSATPPLQLSRCASGGSDAKQALSTGHSSRWRSGTAEELGPSSSPG